MKLRAARLRTLPAVALAATLLLGGCAATPSKVDPFEPMNRAMFEVNDVVDGNVVKPIAELYVAAVPQLVRTGITNVFNNIDDFFSGINGLLQGKTEKAGNDFGRVLLNTICLLGVFDVASDLGIERGNEDFGQTFAVWGFPHGPYLFVPLFGPTTVRDGTGVLVRVYAGPVGFIPYVPLRNSLYGVGYVDLRAQALDAGDVVRTGALDRYLFVRNAYLQRRRYLQFDGNPPPAIEELEEQE
jgi:phospholipid-binding lipoprotein MlaA